MSCLKIKILLSATFCTTMLHAAMVTSLQKPFSQFKGSYDKAVQLYQTGEHDKAIKLYQSIVDLKLDAADVYYNLGLAQLENEQFKSAQESFREALIYNNKDYEASIQLAKEQNININLNSNYKLTKIVIKDMIKAKWGRIVNISSDAAKIGNPGQSNYVASKSAIEGLTRTIANEVASRGITVNCVAPGFIKTEILDSVDKKRLSMMEEKIPLGRIGNVDEIASAVYYLSSEESSYITGQVLHVNGGLTM